MLAHFMQLQTNMESIKKNLSANFAQQSLSWPIFGFYFVTETVQAI